MNEVALYKYVCESGCGRATYTEKHWKIRPFCSSCGERTHMKYKGRVIAQLPERRSLLDGH
mgnify:CR=1 FL=1